MLAVPTCQDPVHPIVILPSREWLAVTTHEVEAVSHDFHHVIYTSSRDIKTALTHYC